MSDNFVQIERKFTILEKLFLSLLVLLIAEAAIFYLIVICTSFTCQPVVEHVAFIASSVFVTVVPVVALWKRNAIGVFVSAAMLVVVAAMVVLDYDTMSIAVPGVAECLFLVQLVLTGSLAVVVALRFRRNRFASRSASAEQVSLNQAASPT